MVLDCYTVTVVFSVGEDDDDEESNIDQMCMFNATRRRERERERVVIIVGDALSIKLNAVDGVNHIHLDYYA